MHWVKNHLRKVKSQKTCCANCIFKICLLPTSLFFPFLKKKKKPSVITLTILITVLD